MIITPSSINKTDMNRRHFIATTSTSLAGLPLNAQPIRRERIRIGQIGLALPHASGKLNAIRSLQDTYELVGVVETNPSLRKKAKDVDFISLEKLMNTQGLKAVAIETRVKDLVSTAMPIIEAGKHTHLDKLADPKLEPFEKLLASAKKQKLCMQMG